MALLFAALIGTFHFVSYAVGQLFNFFGLLDYVDGKEVFIGFVDRSFQFDGKFKKLIGIVLERCGAFLVGLLCHIVSEASGGFVFGGGSCAVIRTRGSWKRRGWGPSLADGRYGKTKAYKEPPKY
jgi:hypothetical protein